MTRLCQVFFEKIFLLGVEKNRSPILNGDLLKLMTLSVNCNNLKFINQKDFIIWQDVK